MQKHLKEPRHKCIPDRQCQTEKSGWIFLPRVEENAVNSQFYIIHKEHSIFYNEYLITQPNFPHFNVREDFQSLSQTQIIDPVSMKILHRNSNLHLLDLVPLKFL